MSKPHDEQITDGPALANRLCQLAKRKGYLLRKSRTRHPEAEDYGLYVLVADISGDRMPGALAARNALGRGEGDTLDGIVAQLKVLGG